MDEKSLYAHILNLTASWQVKALSLDEKVVLLPLLLVSLKTCCYPARPAVKPALYMITGIVNGAISIPASSPP
ncbi:transposase, ISL3 family [Klebsiella pneumoniae]|uniref:Transposase, ISL3 family n=1 Tax=Klebsiella pneumoniae TaxID=573 RepID=A0A2X3CRP3_KLEPN|nr:transposase, ISL3 family [Klebsiella pneumoniae]